MRTVPFCLLGISLFFSMNVARAQSAEDPSQLRAEIDVDKDYAASELQQDGDDFVTKAEESLGGELSRDANQIRALGANAEAGGSPTAVPTPDDSDASIERDIESLESQAKAIGPTK